MHLLLTTLRLATIGFLAMMLRLATLEPAKKKIK
jgi:hypothetical protein